MSINIVISVECYLFEYVIRLQVYLNYGTVMAGGIMLVTMVKVAPQGGKTIRQAIRIQTFIVFQFHSIEVQHELIRFEYSGMHDWIRTDPLEWIIFDMAVPVRAQGHQTLASCSWSSCASLFTPHSLIGNNL